jgi:hypothetical protein
MPVLLIRTQQMNVFRQRASQLMEDGLVAHFLRHYPRESRQAGGPSEMRNLVQQGIQRARTYQLETQHQIGFYTALMIMLGGDFDHDPQLSWAAEQLADDSAGPSDRIQYLFRSAVDYLAATAGEDSELIVRAMLRIRTWDPQTAPDTTGGQWEEDVCGLFQRLYPQKFAFQGDVATVEMLRHSTESAARYGIGSQQGRSIYALHMFMLGSGFDNDLLHPWAVRSLKDPSVATEKERVDKLWNSAMQHLNESLSKD